MTAGDLSLEDKVIKWLAEEGYKLEYITYKAFLDAGLKPVLGAYIDSSEGKAREIDVVVFQDIPNRDPPVQIRVLCECKYSERYPWILLESGLTANLLVDWLSTPQSGSLQQYAPKIEQYSDRLKRCWHFMEGHRFAHSLVEAFHSDKRDVAFNSLQKIANAAWDFVETPERRGMVAHLISIPCLIVQAPLFFAWYDYKADRFAVEQVPHGRLSWSGCRLGTNVDVVHINSVQDYAQVIKITFEDVLSVIDQMLTLKKSPRD